MWEYIITWILVTTVSAPCPDANKADKFGIKSNPNMSCAVYHTKLERTPMETSFKTKDSAIAFYDEIKLVSAYQCNNFPLSRNAIESIKLDSIKIKK